MAFTSTKQKYKSKFVYKVCNQGENYIVNKMLDYYELDNNLHIEPFYFSSILDELSLYKYYFKKNYCSWQKPVLNIQNKDNEKLILNFCAENNIFNSIQIIYSNDELYESNIYKTNNNVIQHIKHETFTTYTNENPFPNEQIHHLYYRSLNSVGLGLLSPINNSMLDSVMLFKMTIHEQILNKINWINSLTLD